MNSSKISLFEFAKYVSSRLEFIRFVEYLNKNYYEKREDWENDTLESFLGDCLHSRAIWVDFTKIWAK